MYRAASRLGTFGSQEIVQSSNVAKRSLGPPYSWHLGPLLVALGRHCPLSGLKLLEPGIGFRARDMKAGFPIMLPCGKGILTQSFALFLALDILLDGLSHNPVSSAPAGRGQTPHPLFRGGIEFQTGCDGRGHGC
jgi:hypothetical protein